MICCGCDESDESDSMLRKQFDKFAEEWVAAFMGREGCDTGAGMYSTIIPTPTWRKIGEMDSDASSASTLIADGKMGRSRPVPMVPRGRYAMGAPRTNMSHCITTWIGDVETESSDLDHMQKVSSFCHLILLILY